MASNAFISSLKCIVDFKTSVSLVLWDLAYDLLFIIAIGELELNLPAPENLE